MRHRFEIIYRSEIDLNDVKTISFPIVIECASKMGRNYEKKSEERFNSNYFQNIMFNTPIEIYRHILTKKLLNILYFYDETIKQCLDLC